jgi:hypothetical protein
MLMYSECLDVLFRATVDVRSVVKNGQVDVVSNICQQNLYLLLCEYILDVLFLL